MTSFPSLAKAEFQSFQVISDKLGEADTDDYFKASTDDIVEAFGSVIQLRMSKDVRGLLYHSLNQEGRKWRPRHVEKLFAYFATVPSQVGDIINMV